MPTTPTTPTGKQQDLDQERLPTRNMSLESQHISAKYTRYLKLLKRKSVTITDLGILANLVAFEQQYKRCDLHLSGYKTTNYKNTLVKSSEYLANCNFANLLVCRTKRLSFNRNASSKN